MLPRPFCSTATLSRICDRFFGVRCAGPILLILLSFNGLAFADGQNAPTGADRWADHPALEPYDLTRQELPSELFLVRTRGRLPERAGIVVHGVHNGVFLVSGDTETVTDLSRMGCAVIPLKDPPSSTRSAFREWVWLDTPDTTIAAMVAQVNWTGVSAKIEWLVDFGTRYSYATNHFTVADGIAGVFTSLGLQPVFRDFMYNGTKMWNVEATQWGTVYPDSFYILCGHFDSISENSMVSAPGADDNGTGTATVLTAAEILTQHDFEYSIRYICFAGEEQGLRGSQDYTAWAASIGLGIVGVLNFDMMGYWETGVEKDLEIETNHASQWLAAAILNAADLYTSAPYELHVYDGAWWGDHASFWDQGYAAVNHEEAWDWGDPDFNPYYHTTNDLLIHVDPDFTVGNIQIGVAALATLAGLVPEGTGVDVPITPPSFAGSLGAFPNPFNGRVNFTVTGLTNRAKVRVLVYDARGRMVDAVPVILANGQGSTRWSINDDTARQIGAGVYFGRLEGLPNVPPVKIVYIK